MLRNLYSIQRLGAKCRAKKLRISCAFLKLFQRLLFPASDVPFSVQIGEGAFFTHRAIGVVIHSEAVIGKNAKIQTGVVIAGKDGGVPVIGDNVLIGTGACILGGVKIGNNVSIGAGAVVLKDVPDNCIAVGIPAKIIEKKTDEV